MSHRAISASIGISSSVADYLDRAARAGLSSAQARELDDTEVEQRLFKLVGRNEPPARAAIDFNWVHRELRKTSVTLQLLWMEYREAVAALRLDDDRIPVQPVL